MQAHHIAGRPRMVGGWKKPTGPSPHAPLLLPPGLAAGLARVGGLPEDWWPEVEDQGSDGDCAGQTVAEIRQAIGLRLGHGRVKYSPKYPYFYARKLNGADTSQDTGTFVWTVCAVAAQPGLCRYELWPNARSIADVPDAPADTDAPSHKALLAFSLPNHQTIKASLTAGFAVGVGSDVPKQMMSPACAQSGLVELPDDDSGWDTDTDGNIAGHAFPLLGFDDDKQVGHQVGAYFCQNHWSRDWGIQGRFWLPYAFFDTGHATDAHTIRLAAGE